MEGGLQEHLSKPFLLLLVIALQRKIDKGHGICILIYGMNFHVIFSIFGLGLKFLEIPGFLYSCLFGRALRFSD